MIHVVVKPNSRKNTVLEVKPGHLEVTLKAKPERGEANTLLILALAEYYQVATSAIHIVTGHTSRHKLVEIR